MRYGVNIVMLGNVGSHSCTIIKLTAVSFGLHPSKRHHDIGFAEFQGITEYIELRNSKNMLEFGGFLGIAERTAQFRSNPLLSKGFGARGLSWRKGQGLPRGCCTHSGAVLLSIKPTTTEIGAEHPATIHRFTFMCPMHGNL